VALIWTIGYAVSLLTGIFLPQIFAAIGGMILLYLLLKGGINRPARHPAGPGLLVVATVLLLAALFSERPLFSLAQLARNFILPLIGFFATLLLARRGTFRSKGMVALIIAGVVSGFYALFQHVSGFDPLYGQVIKGPMPGSTIIPLYGPKGLLNNTLTYAGVQSTIFLFALPIVWRKRGKKEWWYWLLMAFLCMSVFISFKRGPLLAVVLVSGFFFVTRSRRAAIVTFIAGSVLFGALYAGSGALRARISQTIHMSTEAETDRLYLWDAAWRMGSDRPLLGVGPGLWRDYVHDYVPGDRDFVSLAHPHSDPLYLWATSGAFGLLTITFFLGTIAVRGRNELGKWRKGEDGRDYYLGGLLALMGYIIMGFTQCYLIDGENLLTLGFVLGLAFAARDMHVDNQQF